MSGVSQVILFNTAFPVNDMLYFHSMILLTTAVAVCIHPECPLSSGPHQEFTVNHCQIYWHHEADDNL